MKTFRLHGDNIVECERIANLLIRYCAPTAIERGFASLACPYLIVHATFPETFDFKLEFFPGFNKNYNDRWNINIFERLNARGCFLGETPDILLTETEQNCENILAALEFCSALQAGNQAWQRSGRAYSVGRANCPYLYILDFVKYELTATNRVRKDLRFPNPAVAYSYLAYSEHINNFVVQAYIRAEEFQPGYDPALRDFPEEIFGEREIANFLLGKMTHTSTAAAEQALLHKNLQMVYFLAPKFRESFTRDDWREIHERRLGILAYSKAKGLKYQKQIAEKSMFGKVMAFRDICTKYGVGIASSTLPFGLIPARNKEAFGQEVISLYGISDSRVCDLLLEPEDLLVCILKGFKPRGDDDRPDRGVLPFASMLISEPVKVLTLLFGPISAAHAYKLAYDRPSLFRGNGLWKSVMGLSDVIIVDSPCIDAPYPVREVLFNAQQKANILSFRARANDALISTQPNRFQENDVDAVVHYLFRHLMSGYGFECMCNPPGGDWSGLSVMFYGKEYRWLSLPRVSPYGKRPDHVVELFGFAEFPILLAVESKEKASSLEYNIGCGLRHYLEHLFAFKPSVVRENKNENWEIAAFRCDFSEVPIFTAGAFLKRTGVDIRELFARTQCDILFALDPQPHLKRWVIELYSVPSCRFIIEQIAEKADEQFDIVFRVM